MAQIYYYDPQSAGINLQSPQSDSTPWTLTLGHSKNNSDILFTKKGCSAVEGGDSINTLMNQSLSEFNHEFSEFSN